MHWPAEAVCLHPAQASALEAEVLEGSNQYACEVCAGKRDATRQMVLRGLPPYLCLQLQRFVFDFNVGACRGGMGCMSVLATPYTERCL